MNEFNTIWEDFDLPSKGLIYDKPINPHVSLSSMLVSDEIKRLSPTETPYKVMCDIIESRLKEPLGMHVYDLCVGDYQFLLHKIRTITYGRDYKMIITCPKCHEITEVTADLESMEVISLDDKNALDNLITLPKSNYSIELKMQTPKDLDKIAHRNKEFKKQSKSNLDFSLLFTLVSMIDKVDGRKLNELELQEFVNHLPSSDANFILKKEKELSEKVGIQNTISVHCAQCGHDVEVPFRITPEFFGPTN